MSNDNNRLLDVENPPTDLEGLNIPLIAIPSQTSNSTKGLHLDGIPSIRKPGYGNWVWAEKQCARRSGLTIGEGTAIHEAYRVYQNDGDLEEFYVYILEDMRSFNNDLTAPKYAVKRHWRGLLRDKPQSFPFLEDTRTQPCPDFLSSFWAYMSRFIFEDHDERFQERLQTLKTMTQLADLLFDVGGDDQSPPPDDQQSQNHTNAVLKLNDKDDLASSSTHHETTRETRKNQAKSVSAAEHPDVGGKNLKPIPFNASKLDRKRFETLIHELLRSRSHNSGQHLTDDTSSHFLVIGWFPKGSSDPYEELLTLQDDDHLLEQLHKTIKSIRGWRHLFSLKSLNNFGLYQCDIPRGAHVSLSLPTQHANTISHFFRAYQTSQWHPDKDISKAWMAWIHKNLNANKEPINGKYSLELVYNWSPTRLLILVLFPVVLSFGTGLAYMLMTGDASAAWTIASYLVTTAGVIIARLAILGNLKE